MLSRRSFRCLAASLPLLLVPCATFALVGPVCARPATPMLAAPTFAPASVARDTPLGGPVLKAPSSPKVRLAQAPPTPPGEWTGGAAPSGSPDIPGVTYANASDTKNADPGQPPPALGPAPVPLDSIRAVQVGSSRLVEAPMRVGNLDVLAPLVEPMEQLGAKVTQVDLKNVPGNSNAPIDTSGFFQINRAGQSPIVFSVGQNKAWIDKNEQTLRAAPLIIAGKYYLPVFSVAPLLGASARLNAAGTLVLSPTVESVQVFPLRDTVAITVKTSKPLPGGLTFKSMKAADGSARLFVDFPGYAMGFDALSTTDERVVSGGSGDVLRARAGMPSKFPDTTRVTLDLKRPLSGATLQTSDPTIFAFVVTKPPIPPGPGPVPGDRTRDNFNSGALGGMTIVLDAGHGGHDSGARGKHSYEKDRALDITLRLASNLRARGANVLLTRVNDTFVSLQGRVDFANRHRADLFISVHNNASVNKASRGTETFYYTSQSIGLAKTIHRELAGATGLLDRGVSSARFFVIRKTWMPSVLLELAFVSNPNEEKLLNSTQWCQKVADGITRGVVNYRTVYGGGVNG